jgi:hypothetical protein
MVGGEDGQAQRARRSIRQDTATTTSMIAASIVAAATSVWRVTATTAQATKPLTRREK